MKTAFRIGVVLAVMPLLLPACGGVGDPAPRQLVVENHWGGNTGGKGGQPQEGGDAISNFIVDLAVLKKGQLANPDLAPLVITKSYWDETGWGDGAYAQGKRVTKGEYFYEAHDDTGWPGIAFDTTTSEGGVTATIEHPHVLDTNHNPERETLTDQQIKDIRQQNAEDQGLPLTDYADNLPYVQLIKNGDIHTITTVAYPTGVAFDNTGKLWVADNGPDQNFKIFDVSATGVPNLETPSTFGETGGVFSGSIPGRTGDKRFWGPRGVGFGDDGEIIVGTSGIPGQVQGGTDIRAFNSAKQLLWDVKGIFMHSPDIDPSSNGTSIYTAAQRYEMDYSKAPGKSWRQAAVTLDPFLYPGDPRLFLAYDVAFVRVVNGQKFLFVSDMYGYDLAIFRFKANSEIAIPAAFIGIGGDQQGAAWTQGKAPVWTGTWDDNKNRRLMWRDANGNGAVDVGEFSDVQMPHVYARGFDIDENGNVWVAGKFNEHNYGYREGGNLVIPFGSIDERGVPFLGSVPRFVDIPSSLIDAEDVGFTSGRIRYLAATDTTIMATGKNEDYYSDEIYVLDGLAAGSPTRRFKISLGYDAKGSAETDILRADPVLRDLMVLPCVFAADADYLYVGYMQNGLNAPVRGEITVYSMVDGHKVGWIVPGAETNHFAGNFDMKMGIQVRTQADGTRIIVAEENGAGKFMVYRWKP